MPTVVPDASVLLKWALPGENEPHTDNALAIREAALRREIILKVPSLWLYEIGNILSRNFPKQAKELMHAFLLFGFEEPKWTESWLDQCLLLVQKYDVTFYDAAYHGLALLEGGVFVTADHKYVTKTRKAGSVIHLADWR